MKKFEKQLIEVLNGIENQLSEISGQLSQIEGSIATGNEAAQERWNKSEASS